MRRLLSVFVLVAGLVAFLGTSRASADDFDAWFLSGGQPQTVGHPPIDPLPVGSLQKPFLVRAWALSHPMGKTPAFTCTSSSGCWRPSGHGKLDLRGAIRESCNTFFKLLARETSSEPLRSSFRDAGFEWRGDMTEGEAIGLPGPAAVRIDPRRLVSAYTDLVRLPWPTRDDVRLELMAGLRDAANEGTASGVRLRGFLAKTGTVPALDGAPQKTSGFAMVLDDAGFAFLGLLRRGTGREAAIRSGVEIARLRPGSMTRPEPLSRSARPSRPTTPTKRRDFNDPVRVEMLGELRLSRATLKNLGAAPVDSSRGFIGPAASVDARSGDRFSTGSWRIESTKPAFRRDVRASLDVVETQGAIRMIATMTARDYANGVLKAELAPSGPRELRRPLAAAVLRFLGRGARHGQSDVCDSTHCAWFVGEGPVPRWLRPDASINDTTIADDLSADEWNEAIAAARGEGSGPDQWTADCGGDPVSPHFVWGNGDRRVTSCPRHAKGSGKVWRRTWPSKDVAAIFGSMPDAMDVTTVGGQWTLRVRTVARAGSAGKVFGLSYDDVHRRLAQRLGWDAMPAPAARVSRSGDGFVAEGVGFGHRVGLCLSR